jgi:DNA-binding protein H-NS
MAVPNVNKMSLKELLTLEGKVGAAIEKARERERAEVKSMLEEKAARAGFSVQEVFGMRKGRGKKAAVKYRNPQNSAETWAGRGRQPLWLAARLKKGAKLEDFLA